MSTLNPNFSFRCDSGCGPVITRNTDTLGEIEIRPVVTPDVSLPHVEKALKDLDVDMAAVIVLLVVLAILQFARLMVAMPDKKKARRRR